MIVVSFTQTFSENSFQADHVLWSTTRYRFVFCLIDRIHWVVLRRLLGQLSSELKQTWCSDVEQELSEYSESA